MPKITRTQRPTHIHITYGRRAYWRLHIALWLIWLAGKVLGAGVLVERGLYAPLEANSQADARDPPTIDPETERSLLWG